MHSKGIHLAVLLALAALFASASANAQGAFGPIRLVVDATRAPQKILHVQMQMPVHAGPLSLYYPEWIPGEHMPDGPVINVAGLKFTADGKAIPWRRDLVEMFTIHLDVPAGAASIDVDFDFLLSAPASGFSAGSSATAFLDLLSWNQVLLYPKGYTIDQVSFMPSLRLPAGWKFATALPVAAQTGDRIDFAQVSLDELVDSPVLSGRYFRAIDLTPGQHPDHEMDIAADNAAALAIPADMEAHYRALIAEAGTLFGARHYRGYHFLVTLSDDVAHFGLEHHESSDDRSDQHSLIDEAGRVDFSDLLPHEYVHSWNGKYRRPAGLATSDYQQPMTDDLLWVYEGLNEYLGEVLTSRSQLRNDDYSRELLARLVAVFDTRPGRQWRPLQDTADAAVFLYDAGADWSNWRRSTDFYEEGELLWLDVDATIRSLTNDRKSLDDFCKAFHGGSGGQPILKTYTFEDVVAGLNAVAPYDWSTFLRSRLDSVSPATPLESLEKSGWKLVYNDQPNSYSSLLDTERKRANLMLSIGLVVDGDGNVIDVSYGGPSFNAGIGPGMKITAVNGQQYSSDEIANAVKEAENSSTPIQLLISNSAEYKTYSLDYHGGLRNPHIVRDTSRPDYLSEILSPHSK